MRNRNNNEICLTGLDGSNPLGFLAALGTFLVMHEDYPEVKIGWKHERAMGWRPVLAGCNVHDDFGQRLYDRLKEPRDDIFESEVSLPYDRDKFAEQLAHAQSMTSPDARREADLLVGLGYPMDKGENNFMETKFSIMRNTTNNKGEPTGGMLKYIKSERSRLKLERVRVALFDLWDYSDKKPGLRLDPREDYRHAFTNIEPREVKPKLRPVTMLAANLLAVEAFQLLPVFLMNNDAQTTGIHPGPRGAFNFVWPIWTPMIDKDTLRSILSYPFPKRNWSSRRHFKKMGIEEIFCSARIVQGKGFRNFTPARPL